MRIHLLTCLPLCFFSCELGIIAYTPSPFRGAYDSPICCDLWTWAMAIFSPWLFTYPVLGVGRISWHDAGPQWERWDSFWAVRIQIHPLDSHRKSHQAALYRFLLQTQTSLSSAITWSLLSASSPLVHSVARAFQYALLPAEYSSLPEPYCLSHQSCCSQLSSKRINEATSPTSCVSRNVSSVLPSAHTLEPLAFSKGCVPLSRMSVWSWEPVPWHHLFP